MINCPVPALPLELKDIGRLASDALAANAESRNHETPPDDITTEGPSKGPTIADWVSINDHLLGLSKDFLLRVNRSMVGDSRCAGPNTVLLHALTQRYVAAMNPNTAYSVGHFLAAARSFISAMEVRQAMDYHLHSCGYIRTLSNASTLAATISGDFNARKVGSYWLSVDKVKTTLRRHGKRVVCDALRNFAYKAPLNDRSFIIMVDNINDLNSSTQLVPIGEKNIFSCGNLKATHFVIFMADLLVSNDLTVFDDGILEDDFVRDPISHSSVYDLIRGHSSDTHSRVYFSKTEAEQFDSARAASQRADVSGIVTHLFSTFQSHYVGEEGHIRFPTEPFGNSNMESLVHSRLPVAGHIAPGSIVVSNYSSSEQYQIASNDSDIFDDPDAPMSMSRMARAFFGYKGLRGYEPQ
jgi:hypothetical protein